MNADAMDRLVSRTASRIARAWATTLQHIRDANPPAELARRLHGAEPLLGYEDAYASFAAAEYSAYVNAGETAARELQGPVSKKLLTFDPGDPSVLSWAERNKLDLVTGLTMEQRVLIRAALINAEETHENPLVTAKAILYAIGLTAEQEQAVRNYRALLERGAYSQALSRELSSGHSDRAIRAAQDADRELTPAQIDTAVERYRQNAFQMRAETIARTETQKIAHQGSDEMYRQAISNGDLKADQLECGWVATRDSRTRDTHAEMNGQTRPWGEPFESPSGALLRFPGDPNAPAKEIINCRCTRTVRIVS